LSLRAFFFPESTRRKLEVEARLSGATDPQAAAQAALQYEKGGGSSTGGKVVAATGQTWRGSRYDHDGWWDQGL
jgi:hypothetical protein